MSNVSKVTDDPLFQETMKRINQVITLQYELKNCRDELCLRCGSYENAHLGACDGCRYRKGGEWEEGLDEQVSVR